MEKEQTSKAAPLILIVDDVETNRFILRDIIAEMGYRPVLTENGLQALKLVERHKPQLIILDIAMPEMDGYEFCQIIKGNANTRDIPIIFISAFDDPTDIVKGFNLGGEDYITKPFIPEVVKARIGLHLKLSESTKNLADMNRKLQTSITEQLKQMELEQKNVLYALLRVAQENACYDKLHMERLSHNARILTEAMQLSPKFSGMISDKYIETIELAAPLCDLGNMAIPTEILQKGEDLSEEESKVMQRHTTIGARILGDIQKTGDYNDFMEMSLNIVSFHHENWDGSGYPERRKGEEIPLSAQIVATASEYCALTEDRSYRKAHCMEEAFEIMEKDAGVKFNPDIFAILKKIYRQLK